MTEIERVMSVNVKLLEATALLEKEVERLTKELKQAQDERDFQIQRASRLQCILADLSN